jgi:hypothetical protein
MKRVLNVYYNKMSKTKPLTEAFKGKPHLQRLLDRSKPYLRKGNREAIQAVKSP